jgi:hypothetical protein
VAAVHHPRDERSGAALAPAGERVGVMEPIWAEFDGRCGICDQRIVEGQRLVKVDGEWVHAECAEREGEDGDD